MNCPECESKTAVTETRHYEDPRANFEYVQRRRKCLECGHKFVSVEVTMDTWINVKVK
jgi:transcriptional regulator NrdR family protein